MKNLSFILVLLFFGWSLTASANSKPTTNYYNNSFIFVEGGVEFAIYPNGEFDFYYNQDFQRGSSVQISSPNVNISYNSGYNYEPYVQYDDYGAVIQIENVPVYYDYYGRITQAGNIFISYNNFGRVARVGQMYVHYNRQHHFSHYSGFINHYNRQYVYRPWHRYYQRPHINVNIVFNRPYRAYYEPHRVSYTQYVTIYNNHYYAKKNKRKNFYRPSDRVASYNYGRRTAYKRDIKPVKTRSQTKVSSARQTTARDKAYASRNNGKRRIESSNINRKRTVQPNSRATNEVRSGREPVSRRDNANSRLNGASGKMERSSNSRGRSTRSISPHKRSEQSIERSGRATRSQSGRVASQNRSREVKSSPASRPQSRTSTAKRTSTNRNATIKRGSRERSSTLRNRQNSQSRVTSKKSSSRTRSSARNMRENR